MKYYKYKNNYIVLKNAFKELPEGYEEATKEEFLQAQSELIPQKNENQIRIAELKSKLAATDYQCLKWSEGWLTDEEYAPIKVYRQELRNEINTLENSTVIEEGN